MTRRSVSSLARFAALLGALALVAPAWADEPVDREQARVQFDAGTRAFGEKRYREAALAFERAAELRPNGIAKYSAALAWERTDESARAADGYARALELPGLGDAEAEKARARLDELGRSLGVFAITGPVGTRIALDKTREASVPARLHATPGRHTVAVLDAEGTARGAREVEIDVGELRPVDVTLAAVAAATPAAPALVVAPPPPPVVEAPSTRRTLGVALLGAGVATAGAAIVLGLEGLGARDAYDAHPTREGLDHASSLQTMTNVAWISAALLGGGGAALVFWPSASPTSVRVGALPGGVAVRGSF